MRIKDQLSPALIGKTRFYLGIAVGLVFSTLAFGFFAYFREIMRYRTLDSDFVVLTFAEHFWYNLFFAAICVTAGFGFTVWTWFHDMRASNRMPRRRINYISAYSIFWGMGLLYVVAKEGTVLGILFYGRVGYDGYMDWLKELPEILVMMPTLAFLNIWVPIRRAFICGRWMIIIFAAWIAWSTILALSFPLDSSELNRIGERKLAPYRQIVNEETAKARSKGVVFSPLAIEAIMYNTKDRSIKQMIVLKSRFAVNRPVPADSVVLELIIVKKTPVLRLPETQCYDDLCWPFALPRHVYRQLKMATDPIARKYLKEILIEYNQIFNTENTDAELEDGLWQKYANRDRMQGYWSIKAELEIYASIESDNNEKEN